MFFTPLWVEKISRMEVLIKTQNASYATVIGKRGHGAVNPNVLEFQEIKIKEKWIEACNVYVEEEGLTPPSPHSEVDLLLEE